MKKISIVIALLIFLALGIYLLFFQRTTREVRVGKNTFVMEVAETPEQITRGLSGRSAVPYDGMLFILPERTIPAFWMKDMRIPLDFVWVDQGRVVDLTENVFPEPGVSTQHLRRYIPKSPVTYVLEMRAGSIRQYNIALGDVVFLAIDM